MQAVLQESRDCARWLREHRGALMHAALVENRAQHQIGRVRQHSDGADGLLDDAGHLIAYLAQAVELDKPAILLDYVDWIKNLLESRDVATAHIDEVLSGMYTAMHTQPGSPALDRALDYIKLARERLGATSRAGATVAPESRLNELAQCYLKLLLTADRHEARARVMAEIEAGLSVKELYLDVFQPVQREIGRLWQENRIGVSHEHYCTAVTQSIMAELYPRVFTESRKSKRMVAMGAGDDAHELGIRMVADFFEMAGWDTHYLGANLPLNSALTAIEERRPHVVALSATLSSNVTSLAEVITAIRGRPAIVHTHVMVGGLSFIRNQELVEIVGADSHADDAEQAVMRADQII